MDTGQLQAEHYDAIGQAYAAHYDDRWSRRYRERFILDPMFRGISLRGARVLEAMCGSGAATAYLLAQGAQVTGLDISSEVIGAFGQRWPECGAIHGSVLESGIEDGTFDCVAVLGGLHHVQPRVDEAVAEVHRVLRPGGYFCFSEPYSGSLPDLFRRLWYRRDRLFSANEAAVDVVGLERRFAGRFESLRETYGGGPAYFLVYNSMVFRIPLVLKPLYSPLLIGLERLLKCLTLRWTGSFVVCQWRKAVSRADRPA